MRALELRGEVGGPGFNYSQVRAALEAAAGDAARVVVASHGGDCATAAAVHAMLSEYPGPTESLIRFAGSAAVLPSLAPPRRMIVEGGSIFIHRAWQSAVGTCADMAAAARRLQELDALTARGYAEATGQDLETILALMDRSAVLTAAEALALGFVHQVIDEPGGETRPPEIWHRTARAVVAMDLADLSPAGREPAAIAARGEATYQAATLVKDFPLPAAPPGGWPNTTPDQAAELRRRRGDQLTLLQRRLDRHQFGTAPDPRKSPVTAAWRCESCGSLNFHPPGRDGRPTPCTTCNHNTRNDNGLE